MGRIISTMTVSRELDDSEKQELLTSALSLSGLVLLSFIVRNWTYFSSVSQGARARLTISSLLYKKINSVAITSIHEIKIGKVINLIGNDLNDIENNTPYLPNMLFAPYMLTLGAFIMWQYVGFSCFIGIGSMVLMLIGQIFLSKLTEIPRKENKVTTDNRIKFTNEIIECIRLLKMYAWEKPFQKIVENLRDTEFNSFMKIIHIDSIGKSITLISINISVLLICVTYISFGGILSPGNYCLMFSHYGRMFLINFRLILKRVQEILTIKDVLSFEETLQRSSQASPAIKSSEASAEFKNYTAYWSEQAQKPCLQNINLTLHPNTLTTVIGKVGSGKTSLLLSFLREIPRTQGSFTCFGKIAYVEQEPIVFSGSLRDNVLFGKPYKEALYRKVLLACNLEPDLKMFSHGDLTLIGEQGVNLSGGQFSEGFVLRK